MAITADGKISTGNRAVSSFGSHRDHDYLLESRVTADGVMNAAGTVNLTDWQLLGPATPRYLFTDTNAPAGPRRYYRLRYP